MSDDDNDLLAEDPQDDEPVGELDDELGEFEEELDDEDLEDELFGEDLDDGDEDADGLDDGLFEEEDDDEDEEDDDTVSLEAARDDESDRPGEPAVDLSVLDGLDVDDPVEVAEEIGADADDHVRDGEFVCTSCHMAKRASALADADEQLCRDCV
jgi:hypothetical protein